MGEPETVPAPAPSPPGCPCPRARTHPPRELNRGHGHQGGETRPVDPGRPEAGRSATGRAVALLVGAVFLLLGRRVRAYVDEAERVIRTGLAELEHRD